MPEINFENDKIVKTDDEDKTILEISLENDIPHMHVCGGNARCSTCRIRIIENPENLTPPGEQEKKLAKIKGFESDIRLACQAKATGSVTIRRLLHDSRDIKIAVSDASGSTGKEKKIAILFSDIRNFTAFSEKELPYDVIHILTRYFNEMGDAVLNNNGYIDKYIGDGLMCLFGLVEDDPKKICFDAVSAALEMKEKLIDFNRYLEKNYNVKFEIGIGIHFGNAVVGEMGHVKKHQLTAIGDSVNLASRIESATKNAKAHILISEKVFENIKDSFEIGNIFHEELKGKSGNYILLEVKDYNSSGREYRAGQGAKSRLYKIFSNKIPIEYGPLFLRLAFHDAGTFRAANGRGGANGSIRLPGERSREENTGLEKGILLLEEIKNDFPEFSFADLIAFAGAYSVLMLGGPDIELSSGRLDSDDISEPKLMPDESDPVLKLKKNFEEMGLNSKDLVVLSGAHTVGMAYGRPITRDFLKFNNSYFRCLLSHDEEANLLKSDSALLTDPELRKYVELYAVDEELFFRDFAESYKKMTLLGAKIKI